MDVTIDFIEQLASGHEGVDVEFKETTGQLNRGMETLCGMINGSGGIVVFGVSNKGKILGQEVGDRTTREIGEALTRFEPALDIQPTYLKLNGTDRYVIVFRSYGMKTHGPYMWDGKAYQRHDSVTSVMPRERFLHLHERIHGLIYSWENEVNHRLSIDMLDAERIMEVIHGAVRRGRLSHVALNDSIPSALTRMKLMRDGKLCNSAAVLFGKELYDYPQCKVRLARFRGKTKGDFVDNQQRVGNIFELVDATMSFLFKHLMLAGTTHNRIQRADELEIPYDALREAIVNAYCHMAWQHASASVGVAIYDDRVEIENAGRFPVRISPVKLMHEEESGDDNTSLPPNPSIANVMYLAGFVEHWGRGLSMMARECERVGLSAPVFNDNGIIVRAVFQRPQDTRKEYSRSTVGVQPDSSKSTADIHAMKYSKSVVTVVRTIGEEWFTSQELRELMSFKSKPTFRQNYLNPAIKEGLVALENPEKPNSPNQRYGLTLKGKSVLYAEKVGGVERHDVPNDVPEDAGSIENRIIGIIRDNPMVRREDIALQLSLSKKTIERYMQRLGIVWLGHSKTGHWVQVRDI